MSAPTPTALTLHQASRQLEISFDDGQVFHIPFELLRVMSPSAEVQGHGPGQETVQTGKREVGISGVAPVGHYGIQPQFDDGHESGIFTWAYLYEMGSQQPAFWARYEAQLKANGVDRDRPMPPKPGSACASH